MIVTAPDGEALILTPNPSGGIQVSKSTIHSISAAASAALGLSLKTGVGLSGAGAVSQNVVLTKTNAHIDGSKIESGGDVILDAAGKTGITSIVVAASLAIGGGGKVGVGASIGIAVARNFIGFTPEGGEPRAEVQAYIQDSRVTAAVECEDGVPLIGAGSADAPYPSPSTWPDAMTPSGGARSPGIPAPEAE